MRRYADPAWRAALVIAAGFAAGWTLDDGTTTEIVVALAILLVTGAIVNRLWAALLLPAAAMVFGGVTYVIDPAGWNEGSDVTVAGAFILLLIFTSIGATAIAVGIAIRRIFERVAHHGGGVTA